MNLADLSARASRPLFVPFIYRLAARMAQLPEENLLESPTTLAGALRDAQRLFGYDALVSHFDVGLAARACVQLTADRADQIVNEKPWPVIIEATRRLVKELNQTVIMGVLTGPLTLSRQLGDRSLDRAAQTAMALGRAYAECGVGSLLVVEERAITPEEEDLFARTLRSLWNLTEYFQITPLVLARGAALTSAGRLAPAGFRFLALPESLFTDPPDAVVALVQRTVAEAGPGPLIVSTAWEVPPETSPETLRAVTGAVVDSALGEPRRDTLQGHAG